MEVMICPRVRQFFEGRAANPGPLLTLLQRRRRGFHLVFFYRALVYSEILLAFQPLFQTLTGEAGSASRKKGDRKKKHEAAVRLR